MAGIFWSSLTQHYYSESLFRACVNLFHPKAGKKKSRGFLVVVVESSLTFRERDRERTCIKISSTFIGMLTLLIFVWDSEAFDFQPGSREKNIKS